MATQTFVTHNDMQALSQAAVQVQQGNQGIVSGNHKSSTIQPTAILQQGQGGASQFIVTIGDPNGEPVQQLQEVHVPGGQQIIYQQGNQQYTEYNQGTMYTTPVTGTYYSQPTSSQVSGGLSQLQGQILSHGGGTYLVQGGAMDADGTPLAHTARASPATDPNDPRNSHFDVKSWQREVAWLVENYETAEGVSLPRSTLYTHYLKHCTEQKIDPMNPASFGKLIRSVFLGLRTRRLGTRGNSKYHYYGIRIKATSPLNQFTDESTTMAIRQQPLNPGKRYKGSGVNGNDGQDGSSSGENSQQHQHQQFLGDASGAIPNFDVIEVDIDIPAGITQDDVDVFEHMYQQHCECILELVVNLQFPLIEDVWQSFWRVRVKQEVQQNLFFSGNADEEQRLPKEKLFALSQYPPVHKFVRKSDYAFFQALVEVLIPDVLRPIPSSLTQAIRNFAKSLEGWLKNAMIGVPEEMYKAKLGAVSAFAQTLRRYTSLNHLAQAARAVLQNTTQINQMLSDLNRVDFANVQEQASWVCQCDDATVHQLEQDFKKTLQGQNSLEQWAMWLENVVNQVLQPHENSANFPKAARQFLLKWSFYSSMVIRDLTLRSAASFGSFHLIRLLYDEYMFYLVEHKVAAATGETPIAVMGEVKQMSDLGNVMALKNLESKESPKSDPVTAAATASISINPSKQQQPRSQQLQQPQQYITTYAAKPVSASQFTTLNTVTTSAAAAGGYTVVSTAGGMGKTIVVLPASNSNNSGGNNPGSGDAASQPPLKKMKHS